MLTLKSYTPEQTFEYGKKLTPFLKAGDVISLVGELGTGKTVFTKGVAEGLGIKEPVTSPTFVIIREYKGRLPLYHFDLYRISSKELTDLGYEDYFFDKGVTVVEWGEKIKEKLPFDYLSITFLYGDSPSKKDCPLQGHVRVLEFKAAGTFKERLWQIEKLLKA